MWKYLVQNWIIKNQHNLPRLQERHFTRSVTLTDISSRVVNIGKDKPFKLWLTVSDIIIHSNLQRDWNKSC